MAHDTPTTGSATGATAPFDNPRRVVCIYCNYERGLGERDQRCPECGRYGLVLGSDIGHRERVLVWVKRVILGTLVLQVLWVVTRLGLGAGRGGGIVWLGLSFAAFLLGMVGVFVFGAVIDRPAIRRNRALRRLVWPGILGSVMVCFLAAVVFLMG